MCFEFVKNKVFENKIFDLKNFIYFIKLPPAHFIIKAFLCFSFSKYRVNIIFLFSKLVQFKTKNRSFAQFTAVLNADKVLLLTLENIKLKSMSCIEYNFTT